MCSFYHFICTVRGRVSEEGGRREGVFVGSGCEMLEGWFELTDQPGGGSGRWIREVDPGGRFMGGAQTYARRFKKGVVDGRPKPVQTNVVCECDDDEWLRGLRRQGVCVELVSQAPRHCAYLNSV